MYPDIGERYIHYLPIYNNFVIVVAIPLIYAVFSLIHRFQQSQVTQQIQKNDKKQVSKDMSAIRRNLLRHKNSRCNPETGFE